METAGLSSADTLNLLREDIATNVRSFLEEDIGDILLMQYQPGIGKTTGVVRTLVEDNYPFGFFGADHASVQSNVVEIYEDIKHLEGKNRKCQNPRKRQLVELGLLESSYTCALCEHEGFCDYKEMQYDFFIEPFTFAGVHAHIPHLASFVEENYFDAMVIDENFFDSMFLGGTMTIREINNNLEMLYEMESSDERDYMVRFLKDLSTLLISGEMEREKTDGYDLKAFSKEYHKFMLDRLYDRKKTYFNDIQWLVDFLITNNNKLITRRVVENQFRKRYFVDLYQYDFSPLNITRPIIILDATTPKEIYEEIFEPFKKRIITHKPKVVAHSKLYQLTTHSYPMKFLNREMIRDRLFSICENIVKRYNQEKVFFCIRKKFRPFLEQYLVNYDNSFVAHYGGVRGANDYLEADIAVLIGAPFPNPDIVKMKSQAMGVHQEFIHQMECNEEMLQTIHRIRPLLKDETEVFILSNIDSGYEAEEVHHVPITVMEEMLSECN